MAAIIILVILAIVLPGSALVWLGVFFAALMIFLIVLMKNAEDEESGKKPTMRMVEGKNQDIKVYIESRIEKMYAEGKTDTNVAHAFNFFQFPQWLFYHPFLVRASWWREVDLLRDHAQADAFREQMHRKYPQAYSHRYGAVGNPPEIDLEFSWFIREYGARNYGSAGSSAPVAPREPTAQEKSIAWTMVTGDPVLGHALGHKDDKKDPD